MSAIPEKPNADITDQRDRQSLQERNTGAAERAVFGDRGPGGFVRLVLIVVLFIVAAGTLFYFLQA